jgi:hypothetical protein
MSRDEFKSTLRDRNICLPRVKDFITGKHIEFKNNIFTVEEGHEDLNSTLITTNTSGATLNMEDSINSAIFQDSSNNETTVLHESINTQPIISNTTARPIISMEPILDIDERESNTTPKCLGLDKTVEPDQIHWHVDKISDMRKKGRKRQYRVHWSSHNGKKFRPSWQNESNLNCSELIREFDPETTFKKPLNNNDLEITRSEVDIVNKKFKTNNWHVSKRQ